MVAILQVNSFTPTHHLQPIGAGAELEVRGIGMLTLERH